VSQTIIYGPFNKALLKSDLSEIAKISRWQNKSSRKSYLCLPAVKAVLSANKCLISWETTAFEISELFIKNSCRLMMFRELLVSYLAHKARPLLPSIAVYTLDGLF